jgi:hypothetical protein
VRQTTLALAATFATLIAATLPCRAGEPAPTAAGAAIHWNADAARFEVVGVPATILNALRTASPDASAWGQRFGVYVIDSGKAAAAPLLGRYALDGEAVTFEPRFPLRPGLKYRATFDLDGADVSIAGGDAIDAEIELPAEAPRPAATVEAVYPSSDKLPENLLKFYIHFSAPMSRGEAYSRLHIFDVTDPAAPREVPDAFLRLGEELWDASGQRFTLLFDPGRIKRGLVPNEEMGAPLLAGRRYALVVDEDWRDARGGPLAQSFRKEFQVTLFDEWQPDPSAWKLAIPQVGDVEPLIVTFPEPLDRALLERAIAIEGAGGNLVDGVGVALDQESRWMFQPTQPWSAGDYQLVIDPILEDLAGNSVGRAFETRTQEAVDHGTSADAVSLPFKITQP